MRDINILDIRVIAIGSASVIYRFVKPISREWDEKNGLQLKRQTTKLDGIFLSWYLILIHKVKQGSLFHAIGPFPCAYLLLPCAYVISAKVMFSVLSVYHPVCPRVESPHVATHGLFQTFFTCKPWSWPWPQLQHGPFCTSPNTWDPPSIC